LHRLQHIIHLLYQREASGASSTIENSVVELILDANFSRLYLFWCNPDTSTLSPTKRVWKELAYLWCYCRSFYGHTCLQQYSPLRMTKWTWLQPCKKAGSDVLEDSLAERNEKE